MPYSDSSDDDDALLKLKAFGTKRKLRVPKKEGLEYLESRLQSRQVDDEQFHRLKSLESKSLEQDKARDERMKDLKTVVPVAAVNFEEELHQQQTDQLEGLLETAETWFEGPRTVPSNTDDLFACLEDILSRDLQNKENRGNSQIFEYFLAAKDGGRVTPATAVGSRKNSQKVYKGLLRRSVRRKLLKEDLPAAFWQWLLLVVGGACQDRKNLGLDPAFVRGAFLLWLETCDYPHSHALLDLNQLSLQLQHWFGIDWKGSTISQQKENDDKDEGAAKEPIADRDPEIKEHAAVSFERWCTVWATALRRKLVRVPAADAHKDEESSLVQNSVLSALRHLIVAISDPWAKQSCVSSQILMGRLLDLLDNNSQVLKHLLNYLDMKWLKRDAVGVAELLRACGVYSHSFSTQMGLCESLVDFLYTNTRSNSSNDKVEWRDTVTKEVLPEWDFASASQKSKPSLSPWRGMATGYVVLALMYPIAEEGSDVTTAFLCMEIALACLHAAIKQFHLQRDTEKESFQATVTPASLQLAITAWETRCKELGRLAKRWTTSQTDFMRLFRYLSTLEHFPRRELEYLGSHRSIGEKASKQPKLEQFFHTKESVA